jgi:hypothetical protein
MSTRWKGYSQTDGTGVHTEGLAMRTNPKMRTFCCMVCREELTIMDYPVTLHMNKHRKQGLTTDADKHDLKSQLFPNTARKIREFLKRDSNRR